MPDERDIDGVGGWAGSRPVRVGNRAGGQRQYDSLGLFAEAVSVFVQVGGAPRRPDLEPGAAPGGPDRRRRSRSGQGEQRHLGDPRGQAARRRGHRPVAAAGPGALDRPRLAAVGPPRPLEDGPGHDPGADPFGHRRPGLLPQAYGQDPPIPDASALMAVAFGLLAPDDPRAGGLVDALLARLGSGPYLYRYPPGGDDGFAGTEGAFLPMSLPRRHGPS
ncbi:MAG: hypothetical protein WKF73_18805 [Nocardioidaceae bacterium]